VIDDLNAAARVFCAHPVFANPATANRVFLCEEILVNFNPAPADVRSPDISWLRRPLSLAPGFSPVKMAD